jgi:hypothetical protein
VRVAMRVDPDHEVQLVCKHLFDLHSLGATSVPVGRNGAACGSAVRSHAHRADRLLIKPASGEPGRRRPARPDSSIARHPRRGSARPRVTSEHDRRQPGDQSRRHGCTLTARPGPGRNRDTLEQPAGFDGARVTSGLRHCYEDRGITSTRSTGGTTSLTTFPDLTSTT